MPLHHSKDSKGYYYQFGYNTGKKYYYKHNDPKSKANARKKALTQMKAMFYNGYKGK